MPATNELLQEESVSALHSTSAPADGDTLEELLRRNNRPFPATDVLAWAEQLLEELGSLHKASPPVIHQNVRPENIVLSPNGKVKLGGVGLNVARSIGDSHLRYSPLEQIWDGLDAASTFTRLPRPYITFSPPRRRSTRSNVRSKCWTEMATLFGTRRP
jgi:serine/threonine protein kinase